MEEIVNINKDNFIKAVRQSISFLDSDQQIQVLKNLEPYIEKTLLIKKNEIPYILKGYSSRLGYLKYIADDYGADLDAVLNLANVLGRDEDFDGLISSIEDYGL